MNLEDSDLFGRDDMNRPKDCQCKIDLKCLCHYNATSLLYALQLAFVDHNRQNHGTTSNDGERMVEHDHCLLCQKMADALIVQIPRVRRFLGAIAFVVTGGRVGAT